MDATANLPECLFFPLPAWRGVFSRRRVNAVSASPALTRTARSALDQAQATPNGHMIGCMLMWNELHVASVDHSLCRSNATIHTGKASPPQGPQDEQAGEQRSGRGHGNCYRRRRKEARQAQDKQHKRGRGGPHGRRREGQLAAAGLANSVRKLFLNYRAHRGRRRRREGKGGGAAGRIRAIAFVLTGTRQSSFDSRRALLTHRGGRGRSSSQNKTNKLRTKKATKQDKPGSLQHKAIESQLDPMNTDSSGSGVLYNSTVVVGFRRERVVRFTSDCSRLVIRRNKRATEESTRPVNGPACLPTRPPPAARPPPARRPRQVS